MEQQAVARHPEPSHEPIPLRPQQSIQPVAPPAPAPVTPEQPQWSLLTIAGLSAWAEEAMARVGSLRLEILLDLCEAAGHLTPEARLALGRVTEMDISEPQRTPSNNETVDDPAPARRAGERRRRHRFGATAAPGIAPSATDWPPRPGRKEQRHR